jgi:lipopolysaccharide transport system permease protein
MTTMTNEIAVPARLPSLDGMSEPLLKIRVPSGWAALDLKSVWRFRDLCLALALRDVKLRYKQTAMGVIWVILQPLMAAGIFSFVFGKVAKMPSDGRNYFLFCYSGLLAWNLFNSTVTKSSISLVGNSQLISKIFFPRLVLPLSTVPSALLDFMVALSMMVVLMVMYGVHPSPTLALLPFWLSLVLMMSIGAGLWAAALTVPYRDVQYILPVFLQMLLFATPVVYSVDLNAHRIYYLNPLLAIVNGFRSSILGTPLPSIGSVAYSMTVSLGLFLIGAFVFKRMERKFADVI